MKIVLTLPVAGIMLNARVAHAQSTPQLIEIRIRGVNCANGHPLKYQEYRIYLSERKEAPYKERLKFAGSADGKGILRFKFITVPSYVESELFMNVNNFLPSGDLETEVILQKGVVVDRCTAKKRVAISPSPGEITFYDSPIPFWMKLIPKVWE
jgi:hypothetical protein